MGQSPSLPDSGCAFAPPWWLASPHLQTLWASTVRRRPNLILRRERVELTDGDFVDLDWSTGKDGPIILVLHGLEGSSRSRYAMGLAQAVERLGWRCAILNFRGCSGPPNRLERSYHSGDTGDLAEVVARLRDREPHGSLFVVGYSLGGNVLLKWLGESAASGAVDAAVAVSVPFELDQVADRLERGFSQLYKWRLLRDLREKLVTKYRRRDCPLDLDRALRERSFRGFDDAVTAPLHGFNGVDDYYARASCRQYRATIAVATLILHAVDDPFMTASVIPHPRELSALTEIEICDHGGHVGFVQGSAPWSLSYWLEARIPRFLSGFV